MNLIKLIITLLISSCVVNESLALTYPIEKNSDIVGEVTTARVQSGETLADVGRRFGIGIYEMIEANPGINHARPWAGSKLVIPSQFILPKNRKSMIINLAEMRIYYFHQKNNLVSTFAIGIGRKDWETPLGYGKIIQKKKDPSWVPPSSIRAWYKENNMHLPDVVPPGPKNPLGKYAMRLSIPGYLIHGTNRPSGIGLRTSSGCIRLYPEDIETLFNLVPLSAEVQIINKPFKFGNKQGKPYLEAHEPLTGEIYQTATTEDMINEAFKESSIDKRKVDERYMKHLIKKSQGLPLSISID